MTKHRVTFNNHTIKFDVIRSDRVKTSEITVDSKRILVRVPASKDSKDIEKMVVKKAEWILKKQQEYSQLATDMASPTFEDGSRLFYLGSAIPMRLLAGKEKDRVVLLRGTLVFTTCSLYPTKGALRTLYENWLGERAKPLLPPIVSRYAKMLDVAPRKVVIKRLRQRWGSATKDGTLNLNVNLLKAPEEVIEYVVLHELSHLKERNHSHRFWALVNALMPNYKAKTEWLRLNALGLIE